MKTIISLIIVLILTGCIAGERIRQSMGPGISQDQVTQIMGKPDGFQQRGGRTALAFASNASCLSESIQAV